MKKSAHLIVKGLVQGIGYRYFAYRTAKKHNLVGWVRNLENGNVEIEVEGEENTINKFIEEIKTGHRWAEVYGVDIKWSDTLRGYTNFEIRF